MAELNNVDIGAEKKVNLKAEKFDKFLAANNIAFFERHEAGDETQTIVFRSNIKVDNQVLPVVIITDSTIYTILRVQVGTGLVSADNKVRVNEYLNGLNRSYKVFKYVYDDKGTIYLDCCLPSSNESFDPEIVRIVLDVVVQHLQTEFPKLLKTIWQ